MKIATASSLLQSETQQQLRAALTTKTTVTVAAAKPEEVPALLSLLASPHGSTLLANYTSKHAEDPVLELDPAARQITHRAINEALRSVPPSAAASFTREHGHAIGSLAVGGSVAGALIGALAHLMRAAEPTGATGYLATLVVGAMVGGTIGIGVGAGAAGGASGGFASYSPLEITGPKRFQQ